MPAAKLVVIYPVSTDLEQFERRYLEHHVPMAVDRLAGKTARQRSSRRRR
jgi:hypothetical protein